MGFHRFDKHTSAWVASLLIYVVLDRRLFMPSGLIGLELYLVCIYHSKLPQIQRQYIKLYCITNNGIYQKRILTLKTAKWLYRTIIYCPEYEDQNVRNGRMGLEFRFSGFFNT